MRRGLLLGLVIAGLLVGCAAPVPPPPAPPPPPASGLTKTAEGWEVGGLKHGPVWHIWSPDQKWVAFHLESGIWVASPDGREEHWLVRRSALRELVGWWQGGLVYLEYDAKGVAVAVARPGHEPRQIAYLDFPDLGEGAYFARPAIYEHWLALFPARQVPVRVDLNTGDRASLGPDALEARCISPQLSQDSRYALIHNACGMAPAPVRLFDLREWSVRQVPVDAYQFSLSWSPTENRWVALIGPPWDGTGTPPFGDTLALGDEQGGVRYLKPPQPLKLRGAPHWSADGRFVSVEAQAEAGPDFARGFADVNEVWAVTPATGEWRRLARLTALSAVGWHPSGEYLVVFQYRGSAVPPRIGKLPADGGVPEFREPPVADRRYATYLDAELMIVSGGEQKGKATAYLPRPDGLPPLAIAPGQRPYIDDLQIRPPYASWVDQTENPPKLVVAYRP